MTICYEVTSVVAKGSFHSPPPPQTHFPLHWPWGANKVQMLNMYIVLKYHFSKSELKKWFLWIMTWISVKCEATLESQRTQAASRSQGGGIPWAHPHRMSIVSWEWRLPRDPLLLMRRHIPPVWVEFLGQNVAAGPSNSVSEHAWKRLAFSRAK